MKLLVTGETGCGKTTYLVGVAAHEAFLGNRTIMYTGETPEYIENLIDELPDPPNDFVSVVHGLRNMDEIRDDLFNVQDGYFHTVILDGIQYLMNVGNMAECQEKLSALMYDPSNMNLYISVPTRKDVFRNDNQPGGSTWLASSVDRVIQIDRDGKNIDILKDRYTGPSVKPIKIFI